jgi:hypothetical protein
LQYQLRLASCNIAIVLMSLRIRLPVSAPFAKMRSRCRAVVARCVRRSFCSSSSTSSSSSASSDGGAGRPPLDLFQQQQRADYSGAAWGKFADEYDRSFGYKFRSYARAVLQGVGGRLGRDGASMSVSSPRALLDIGCGTGAVFDALVAMRRNRPGDDGGGGGKTPIPDAVAAADAEKVLRGIDEVVCVDFSEEMVEFCNRTKSSPSPSSLSGGRPLTARFQQGNAEKLFGGGNESTGRFDVVRTLALAQT